MNTPKLESYVRKVRQPRGGYIPASDLKTKEFGGVFMPCATNFSPMLLSSVVQQIVAFCACDRGATIQAMSERIQERITELPASQQVGESQRIRADLSRMKAGGKIDADLIRSMCHLLTYAPAATGGKRRFPDGGYIEPLSADIKLIWALSRRAYAFLYDDAPEQVEFKRRIKVHGSSFSSATVDFLTPEAAYKIVPAAAPSPTSRDILLAFVWATLAQVDRFGIYNPMRDVLWWGRVSDLPAGKKTALLSSFLNN